jgi:hypothetical protein
VSISLADIVQTNTGTFNASSGSATLASGTLVGSTIILCVQTYGSSGPSATGFTRDHGSAGLSAKGYILRKSNSTGGETTWAFTGFGAGQPVVWFALEIVGLEPVATFEANATYASISAATSFPTNTSPLITAYETLAIAFHGGQNTVSSTVPTWSGQTNDYVEILENSRVDGATATSAAVSVKFGTDVGTYQSTATASISTTGNAVTSVYVAKGARRLPNVDVMTGLEFGTTAGLTTGNTSNPPFDSSAGTPAVVTTTPRSGTYCLELSATSAAEWVAWTSTGALSLYTAPPQRVAFQQYVFRLSFRFPGSLPGADVGVCALDAGTGTAASGVWVVYRTASQKLGVQIGQIGGTGTGLGTEVLSANTLVADTWYNLDLSVDMANEDRQQLWSAYWQLDSVAQVTAVIVTDTTVAPGTFTQFRLGWLTSTTATIRYDDIVGSKHPGHYPLGPIGIYALGVDPAGTVAVTTATSFSTMTANGTLNTTFSTTTARGAVDEIPPTIGASADGFVQDTTAATDYVELPMTTRAAATNLQAIRGVRWYFPGWAVSATAATIGFRAWDGTAETLLFAAADPNFDNSTTTPAWVCRMHRALASNVPYVWTQALLDALAARVGFSTSAAVNVGIHSAIAEVAMRDANSQQVIEADGVFLYARLDPDTGYPVAYRLAAAIDCDAWGTYVINAATVNRTAIAGGEDVYIVGAESNAVVSFLSAGRIVGV